MSIVLLVFILVIVLIIVAAYYYKKVNGGSPSISFKTYTLLPSYIELNGNMELNSYINGQKCQCTYFGNNSRDAFTQISHSQYFVDSDQIIKTLLDEWLNNNDADSITISCTFSDDICVGILYSCVKTDALSLANTTELMIDNRNYIDPNYSTKLYYYMACSMLFSNISRGIEFDNINIKFRIVRRNPLFHINQRHFDYINYHTYDEDGDPDEEAIDFESNNKTGTILNTLFNIISEYGYNYLFILAPRPSDCYFKLEKTPANIDNDSYVTYIKDITIEDIEGLELTK